MFSSYNTCINTSKVVRSENSIRFQGFQIVNAVYVFPIYEDLYYSLRRRMPPHAAAERRRTPTPHVASVGRGFQSLFIYLFFSWTLLVHAAYAEKLTPLTTPTVHKRPRRRRTARHAAEGYFCDTSPKVNLCGVTCGVVAAFD